MSKPGGITGWVLSLTALTPLVFLGGLALAAWTPHRVARPLAWRAELAICRSMDGSACAPRTWLAGPFVAGQRAMWWRLTRLAPSAAPSATPAGLTRGLGATLARVNRAIGDGWRRAIWFAVFVAWPRWAWLWRWKWIFLAMIAAAGIGGWQGRAVKRDMAQPSSAALAAWAERMAAMTLFAGAWVAALPVDFPLAVLPAFWMAALAMLEIRLEHWARSG